MKRKLTKVALTRETQEVEVEFPAYSHMVVGDRASTDIHGRIDEEGRWDCLHVGPSVELESETVDIERITREHPGNWAYYLGEGEHESSQEEYREALGRARQRLAGMWQREFGEPMIPPTPEGGALDHLGRPICWRCHGLLEASFSGGVTFTRKDLLLLAAACESTGRDELEAEIRRVLGADEERTAFLLVAITGGSNGLQGVA